MKATRCKEVAGYTGPDATVHSMEEMSMTTISEILSATLSSTTVISGIGTIATPVTTRTITGSMTVTTKTARNSNTFTTTKLIEEKVIKKTFEEIELKNGEPAITLYGSHTHLHINLSGKFILGGPQGDADLQVGRLASILMVAGARVAAVFFQARIRQRWTDLRLTSAVRWSSP